MSDKMMTLEQVRDEIEDRINCFGDADEHDMKAWLDAITIHLSQPTESGEAVAYRIGEGGAQQWNYYSALSVTPAAHRAAGLIVEPLYTAPPPAAGVPTIDVAAVRVDHDGVKFGTDCWYSHEHITGATAYQLNEGTGNITQRAYMKWVQAYLAIGDAK